ncbi:MAG: protein kinase, partial [Firmicutes bacterium]|nr:protein kinase [Bacillota bacterium]
MENGAMTGTLIAHRYELFEKIGVGGMSVVYRAHDTHLKRWVAIKILRDPWAEQEDIVQRFIREAHAASSISNAHVVQVFDVGFEETGRWHYLVMELVSGGTLRDMLDQHAPLALDQAVGIADQIADGLEAAHQHQMIHRDIKPQNILIDSTGIVKIADFGIAYAAWTGTLVNTQSMLGTAYYVSPEQARGKLATPQSDIYSLGIVLFEMVAGQVPFRGDNALNVALKHVQTALPSIKSLRLDVPDLLVHVIERALSKDVAERYSTVGSL